MRFFRETNGHTCKVVASHLDVSVSEYEEIETGKILLTKKQARQLGKLFHVKRDYFYEAALQLDLLLTKNEIINIQKGKIDELKQHFEDLKKTVNSKAKKTTN